MRGKQNDEGDSPETAQPETQNANALIAMKLRGYYDSIIEEGTPPQFLDLLERLDKAERGQKD
ncbi:NepR family anti-sigma factor [Rhizobium sp. CAU 1783]